MKYTLQPTPLVRYDAARLSEAYSVDEAKDIRDKAVALEAEDRGGVARGKFIELPAQAKST